MNQYILLSVIFDTDMTPYLVNHFAYQQLAFFENVLLRLSFDPSRSSRRTTLYVFVDNLDLFVSLDPHLYNSGLTLFARLHVERYRPTLVRYR